MSSKETKSKKKETKSKKKSLAPVGKKGMIAGAVGVAAAAAATVAAFKTFSGASRSVFHVMPHDKGWQIRKSGRKSAVQVFEKKRPARDRARALANESEPSQLVIHREDGTVQAVHTYGE